MSSLPHGLSARPSADCKKGITHKFLAGTSARSAGAWKVIEYLRMISDWLGLGGLELLVIGKGLIGHHPSLEIG